jgi:hypothetical protein
LLTRRKRWVTSRAGDGGASPFRFSVVGRPPW